MQTDGFTDEEGVMTTDITELMTQAGLPTDNLISHRAALPAPVQVLHRRVLLSFATTGDAPSAGQLGTWATELGVELAPSLHSLAEAELVFLDTTGRQVLGGVPFAAGGSAHHVRIAGGPTVAANCAVDALGISAMLGRDTDVRSTDPLSGEPITAISRDGQWSWQPAEAAVFVGSSGSGRLTQTCCPIINFFTSPEQAAAYQAERGLEGVVLSLSDAARAGALAFGGLLDEPQS